MDRGEVYFVALDPTIGREIGGNKLRPVVVLSINDINRKPLVVSVVPGTGADGKPSYYRNSALILATAANGLRKPTLFQGHQLRALDHSRFSAAAIGRLNANELMEVERAVRYSLGLM